MSARKRCQSLYFLVHNDILEVVPPAKQHSAAHQRVRCLRNILKEGTELNGTQKKKTLDFFRISFYYSLPGFQMQKSVLFLSAK